MNAETTSDHNRRVNYVFVDYENVQQVDPSLIGTKSVQLTLLLGARQTKFDAKLRIKPNQTGRNVRLDWISGFDIRADS